jgi:hypothetical protein
MICLNKAVRISSLHLPTSAEGTMETSGRYRTDVCHNFSDLLRFSEQCLLRIHIISDLTLHLVCHVSEDPIPLSKLTPE